MEDEMKALDEMIAQAESNNNDERIVSDKLDVINKNKKRREATIDGTKKKVTNKKVKKTVTNKKSRRQSY